MSIEVNYAVANNWTHAKEPKKATCGSTGYDLLTAELTTLISHKVTPISIKLSMKIPDEYFEERHFIICDGGGVIDSDYCGVILVLINHGNEPYLLKKDKIIAQFVLHKKQKILFKQVCCLEPTVRGDHASFQPGF